MHRRTTAFLLLSLVAVVVMSPSVCRPQEQSQGRQRKVLSKLTVVYPELARLRHVEGTVRLEVTVAPNGTVKLTKVLGGSPLLAEAAESSIMRWKWEPELQESTEIVELHFHP
jgi:TonB family protein